MKFEMQIDSEQDISGIATQRNSLRSRYHGRSHGNAGGGDPQPRPVDRDEQDPPAGL